MVSSTTEPTSPNSKKRCDGNLAYSHPGFFGKNGQRHFHLKRNQYHCPTVNLDSLWSLVSHKTRENAEKSKDKAAVIDVTKAVCLLLIIIYIFSRASSKCSARESSPKYPSSSRPSCSPPSLKRRSRQLEAPASSTPEEEEGSLSED